jgi:hypothetical protein
MENAVYGGRFKMAIRWTGRGSRLSLDETEDNDLLLLDFHASESAWPRANESAT